MTGEEKIEVQLVHTDEMMADELRAMLGMGRVRLTLGAFAALSLAGSPYVHGGAVTEEALETAMSLVDHDEMSPLEFHDALQRELDAAFRVFETIQPDPQDAPPGRTSEIIAFSPEWFSDLISSACQSMPSITYDQAWNEIPMAMICHLAVSTDRRSGAVTARAGNVKDALAKFREMRHKEPK